MLAMRRNVVVGSFALLISVVSLVNLGGCDRLQGGPARLIDFRGETALSAEPMRSAAISAPAGTRRSELGRSPWEIQPRDTPTEGAAGRSDPPVRSAADRPPGPPIGGTLPGARQQRPKSESGNLPDVPVLCYHLNLPGRRSFGGFNITPDTLERQLRELKEQGYRTIRLGQLEALVGGRRTVGLPQKPVVLTFDDGAVSNLTSVEPILRRLDFTAVLFFYPTILSSGKKRYLNWAQARRLAASDRFEIGSHTYWHPKLPELKLRDLRMQLAKSRRVLEEKLGLPGRVTALAYPFGLYDRRVIREARAAGYRVAFTINPTRVAPGDDPFTLNRYMVSAGHSMEVFRRYVSMRSPTGMSVSPPDGSRLTEGRAFSLELPGVRLDSVRVRLNGRRMALEKRGGVTVAGRLPRLGARRYLTVTVRARTTEGRPVVKQMLYRNGKEDAAGI